MEKQKKWVLYIDTDSLYMHMKENLDEVARLDYLKIPSVIYKERTIFFDEKYTLIMRHGKSWKTFSESLEKFGYSLVPCDKGMQLSMINQIYYIMQTYSDGIVLVTSNDEIGNLIEQVLESGKRVVLYTFSGSKSQYLPFLKNKLFSLYEINDTWFWKR